MKKSIQAILLGTTAFLLMSLVGCQGAVETEVNSNEEVTVATSFYPITYLTQEIAGDALSVISIVPSSSEPHGYEPTIKQMASLESADLLVFQGAGMEPWVEAQEDSLESKGVKLLEVTSHLELLETKEGEHHEEDEDEDEDEDEHGHDHGEFDPHTWLDPLLTIETITLIEGELSKLAPIHSDTFKANAEALRQSFSQLDNEFKASLNSCEIDTFITSHDAFQYLAHRYDLEAVSISGISPYDEPSAAQIAELVEHSEEEDIRHIFLEVLTNAKVAETLANEAGLTTLTLDPIAGLSQNTINEDYLSLMKANLENLKIGLRCQNNQ